MRIQGKPENMQVNPVYTDVVKQVLQFFIGKLSRLRSLGIKDVIIDPALGLVKQSSKTTNC